MTGRSNQYFRRISLFDLIHSQLMQCPGRCNILRLHHHLPFLVLWENRDHLIKLQPFCQIKCGNRQSFLKTGAVTVQPRKPFPQSKSFSARISRKIKSSPFRRLLIRYNHRRRLIRFLIWKQRPHCLPQSRLKIRDIPFQHRHSVPFKQLQIRLCRSARLL